MLIWQRFYNFAALSVGSKQIYICLFFLFIIRICVLRENLKRINRAYILVAKIVHSLCFKSIYILLSIHNILNCAHNLSCHTVAPDVRFATCRQIVVLIRLASFNQTFGWCRNVLATHTLFWIVSSFREFWE